MPSSRPIPRSRLNVPMAMSMTVSTTLMTMTGMISLSHHCFRLRRAKNRTASNRSSWLPSFFCRPPRGSKAYACHAVNIEPGARPCCRDTNSVRGLIICPSLRGDGAPKSANPMARVPLPEHAGASRRANCSVCSAAGRAFRFSQRSVEPASVVSQLLAGTPSGPGQSPDAARVLMLACTNPRAPHLVPPHERLMRTPLSGRGGCILNANLRTGIMSLCARSGHPPDHTRTEPARSKAVEFA
jgi:hypothetical protein